MKVVLIVLAIFAVIFLAGLIKGGRKEGGAQVLWFMKFFVIAAVVTMIAIAIFN